MKITARAMGALFDAASTKFNEAMKRATTRVLPNDLMVEDIATTMQVSGAATAHAWMKQLGGMKEWTGSRSIKGLDIGELVVTNRRFEETVSIPRTDIEDDQYGVYADRFAALGANAQNLWLELAEQTLITNDNWADANPFFATGRKLGDATITNVKADTPLSRAAVESAVADMRGWTLDGGKPANVRPRVLVVGPSNEALAKMICEAELVSDGSVTVSNVSTARALQVRVSGALVGDHASEWYIFGEAGGVKGIVVQQRKLPVLTRKDSDSDDNVFLEDTFYYGTDARGEAFKSLPFLIFKGGDRISAPIWSAAS